MHSLTVVYPIDSGCVRDFPICCVLGCEINFGLDWQIYCALDCQTYFAGGWQTHFEELLSHYGLPRATDSGNVHSSGFQICYEVDYLPHFLHDHSPVDYRDSQTPVDYLLHRQYYA